MTAHEVVEQAPRTRESVTSQSAVDVSAVTHPCGPAAAVVLAAGIACFALGLLSLLTAASESVSDALTLSARVGDISGLSTATIAVFFASWAGLAIAWRHANPRLSRVAAVTAALAGFGLVGTFPPVFNALG